MLEAVGAALSSKTRIEIVKILCQRPASLIEVYREINKTGIDIKYRATVFRALKKLVSTGLVEKIYDQQKDGIYYKLIKKDLVINLRDGSIV